MLSTSSTSRLPLGITLTQINHSLFCMLLFMQLRLHSFFSEHSILEAKTVPLLHALYALFQCRRIGAAACWGWDARVCMTCMILVDHDFNCMILDESSDHGEDKLVTMLCMFPLANSCIYVCHPAGRRMGTSPWPPHQPPLRGTWNIFNKKPNFVMFKSQLNCHLQVFPLNHLISLHPLRFNPCQITGIKKVSRAFF